MAYGGIDEEDADSEKSGPASSDYDDEERAVLSDVFDEEQVEALITAIKLCVDRRMSESGDDETGSKSSGGKGSDALAILIGSPKKGKKE